MQHVASLDPYSEGLKFSAKGEHARAIDAFERALNRAPNDTKVLFALGNTARALGLAGPAEQFFRRVLAHEPNRVEAVVNLVNLLRVEGRFEAAAEVLAPALEDNPGNADLWLTRGGLSREIDDRASAVESYRKALALRRDFPEALCNLADIIADAGDVDTALSYYDQALRLDPGNPQAHLNRAILHLQSGRLKDGWRDYAYRLKLPSKVPVPDHKLQRWSGSSLKRQRLLVTAEQGVGDQIMFASLIPELAARAEAEGGSLILECEPRLVSLFSRSFPTVKTMPWVAETRGGTTSTQYAWLKSVGGASSAIEMGSLPRLLRASIGSFPVPHTYLVPDAGEVAIWRDRLAKEGTVSVGVCWRSGKIGGHRSVQFAALNDWAVFLRDLPATIVSVQYDATEQEIATLEQLSGRKIVVPEGLDQKNDLDRAAGLFTSLDLIVSAPTAVSWLAAAVGTETYKVLYDTSWTSFGETYEPFAPSCYCIMPKNAGNWTQTFSATLKTVKERFSTS